jgi:hypothetical protein
VKSLIFSRHGGAIVRALTFDDTSQGIPMKKLCVAGAVAIALAGCGGSSTPEEENGIINISITDAAVDDVAEVWVEFSAVSLKPQDGEDIVVEFDPAKSFNLLELQDGRTAALLPDTSVPVGRYQWIRLGVNAEFDNVMDSYALLEDGSQVELRVPSGSQSGLKLVSGFTVTQNQSTNMVVDWDLRKALTNPVGQPGYHLRPALRVTDMAAYGSLTGTVDATLTMADGCGDENVGNAVYVYGGIVDMPLDIRGADTDPLVTASVGADLTYSVTFLSAGDYTVAFTCHADDDTADVEDDITFDPVDSAVTIVDGETTVVDFTPPPE